MTLKEKFRPLVLFKDTLFNVHQNKEKDENSIKCEQIADKHAIGFVEWCDNIKIGEWSDKTTEELLQIYKKEKRL